MPVTTKRINRIQRGINVKLLDLERKFAIELNSFYKQNIEPLETVMPPDSIRRKYEAAVYNKFRKMVETAYLEGTGVVGKEIQRKDENFTLFVSNTDTTAIATTTAQLIQKFWFRVAKLVQRKNEFILKTVKGEVIQEPLPELNRNANMAAIASAVVFSAFSNGVKEKIKVIDSPNVNVPAPAPAPSSPSPTIAPSVISDDTFVGELELGVRALGEDLIFITKEDSNVCPICEPLNKTVYDKNEPDLPEPQLHDWCRCKLIPLI